MRKPIQWNQDIACSYCNKMGGKIYEHRDSTGKPVPIRERCLAEEVAGQINDRHAAEGNIRKYNEARRAEQKYRKYYEKDPEKARPLP